jgi:membrane associated rhomboid family serine protease/TPR repeat protein
MATSPPAVPSWREFPHYTVVAMTAVLSIVVTVAWTSGVEVSPLFANAMLGRGQLWRLVTSILPHGGWMHLAFNVYWLWVFGTFVERVWGPARTLALILVLAVGSSAWEYALLSGGVGLSGVGYGMFGLLWVLSRKDERFAHALDQRTTQIFVGWFFFCIVTTLSDVFPVANVAHGVGAVLGALIGFAMTGAGRRRLIVTAIAVIVLGGVGGATVARPIVNLSSYAGLDECKRGYDAYQEKRIEESVYWYRKAVKYRSIPGLCWSGLAFGEQQSGRLPQALDAYRRGADAGDGYAQKALGDAYSEGRDGLPKSDAQAIFWYRKAADNGSAAAQNDLAWLYLEASDPSLRNSVDALTYAKKAVSSKDGSSNAYYLDTLAAAYHANKEYDRALHTQQQAVTLNPAESDFKSRLQKYECAATGKACS